MVKAINDKHVTQTFPGDFHLVDGKDVMCSELKIGGTSPSSEQEWYSVGNTVSTLSAGEPVLIIAVESDKTCFRCCDGNNGHSLVRVIFAIGDSAIGWLTISEKLTNVSTW